MRDRIDLLTYQTAETYDRVWNRLQGLTNDEYWWEPVPDSWTLRRQPDGRLEEDYAIPDPVPAPFTTIAWRLFHLASCKVVYHEYAYGPGKLNWLNMHRPETVDENLALLQEGQRLLLDDLAAMADDADLDQPVSTNWGETWPAWRIFWTMIHHDAHHGAELGTLRDLWLHQRAT
jgi:hypothetical protein